MNGEINLQLILVVKNLNYRIEDCDMIANALSRDGKSGHMMSWGKKGKIMKRLLLVLCLAFASYGCEKAEPKPKV